MLDDAEIEELAAELAKETVDRWLEMLRILARDLARQASDLTTLTYSAPLTIDMVQKISERLDAIKEAVEGVRHPDELA